MKRIPLVFFMMTAMASYAQKTELTTVNTVTPKKGQKMAFEAAYKAHTAKFHKTTDNVNVYEIMSGPNAGSYHIAMSGRSYADFDKERPDAAAHSMELDKSFFPYLDQTNNATYRYFDSLSLRPDTKAEKFVVTVRYMKQGVNMADYRKESSRNIKVAKLLKGGFWDNLSNAYYEKIWAGTSPVQITIRALKDGFKSLEADYYGAAPTGVPSFRDEYAKMFGHADWDTRVKLLDAATDRTEVYIMKWRKDLSSGQ